MKDIKKRLDELARIFPDPEVPMEDKPQYVGELLALAYRLHEKLKSPTEVWMELDNETPVFASVDLAREVTKRSEFICVPVQGALPKEQSVSEVYLCGPFTRDEFEIYANKSAADAAMEYGLEFSPDAKCRKLPVHK